MKEKECKYFMTGTDEEVFLGDVIETEVVKEFEDGRKITRELEFKLTEDTLPLALEMNIIECVEKESEDQQDIINFEDKPCEELSNLIEDFEGLEERFDNLEEFTKGMYAELKKLVELQIKEEKKTASPKKK